MADNFHEISSREDFEKKTQSGVALVDFYAAWCRPCQMQTPILHLVADANPEASILKVNTDQLPELAQAFRVSSIPHLVLLKDGQPIDQYVGLQEAEFLSSAIENA
jgi:thioredoxin 1